MEVKTLELFMAVTQAGSFAAAARQWGLDPSQVSRQIAALEQELGFPLFQRSTRKLVLSEAGAHYLGHISGPLVEIRRAAQLGQREHHQLSGKLRLTSSVAFGQSVLLPLLTDFYRRYPEIQLDLLFTDAVVDLLAERVDLAIRLTPTPDENLVGTRLFPVRYRVCASPDYVARQGVPLQPRDLVEHPCVVFPYRGYRQRWQFRNPDESFSVAISSRLVISNALGVLQACRLGYAPALLADWLAAPMLQSGELVDLFPDYEASATDFAAAVWALYPRRDYLSCKTRVVLDYFRECLMGSQQPDQA